MSAAPWTGATARVSVSSVGVEGNSSDSSSISDDGRYISFTSFASNLVPADANGVDDVFLPDRRDGTTSRVSVSSTGAELYGPSFGAAISADGRFVAFTTGSANAVPSHRNGVPDVFVRDRRTGTSTQVSRSTDRTQANNTSGGGSISTDGRRVAFLSHATNLVPGDTSGPSTCSSMTSGLASRAGSANPRTALRQTTRATAIDQCQWATCCIQLVRVQPGPGDTNDPLDVFVRSRKADAEHHTT
jgi:Tol biopolymer transport system component